MSQVVRKEPQRSSTSKKENYYLSNNGIFPPSSPLHPEQQELVAVSAKNQCQNKTKRQEMNRCLNEYLHSVMCLGPSGSREVEQ